MTVRLCVAVSHAAFDDARRRRFEPSHVELLEQCRRFDVPLFVASDLKREGSLATWLRCCDWALTHAADKDVTHAVFLPDDAILVPRFVEVMQHLIEARPDAVMCMLSNHADAPLAAAASRAQRDALVGARFLDMQKSLVDSRASDAELKRAYAVFSARYQARREKLDLDASYRWYSTSDGSALFGGVFPLDLLREHLEWRKTEIFRQRDRQDRASGDSSPVPVANDEGVNLWAISTGRRIYKPLPSPCQHDLTAPSVDGNEGQKGQIRCSLAWDRTFDFLGTSFKCDVGGDPDAAERWGASVVADLGRTYLANHWDVLFKTDWEALEDPEPLLERVYAVERQDYPMPYEDPTEEKNNVTPKPYPLIATPSYNPPLVQFLNSREEMLADLRAAGIAYVSGLTTGASFVPIARNMILHQLLSSRCTGVLFIDSDIEVVDPKCFRKMLATGHPVIGLAYPIRDASGRVAGNMLTNADALACPSIRAKLSAEDRARMKVEGKEPFVKVDADMTMPVRDLGTGYLYIAREVVVKMCAAYPETLHLQDGWFREQMNAPGWALFDGALEEHLHSPWTKRYTTEDYTFLARWRRIGGEIRCYLPPQVRHWGLAAFDAHVEQAWKLEVKS